MAQITRKVTFDADGAPNPRIIAVGMQGDNNARMLLLNLPSITENQNVYVNVENGEHADTVRLYQNDDGLWGWSISANSMAVFGNGTAQVKIIDPGDPLDIKWQSGKMQLSLGASMDTDSTISERNITLLEQIQEELQTAEETIAGSAASVSASVNYARGYAEDAETAYQGAVTARESSEYHADRSEEAAQSASDIADTLAQAAAEAIRTANEAAARAEAAADEATEIAIDKSIDSRYVHSADFTGRKIVSKIADADGSGSGLDADLLDGKEASYFEDISNIRSGALSAEHGGTGLENPDAGYVLEGGGENSALQLRHIATEAPTSGSGDLITSGMTYAALQGKADIAQTFAGTLLASGWANGIQTLSNSAITAESIVRLTLADSITAQQQSQAAYARIRLTGQTAGAITVAADGTIPSVNIPVKIIIEGVNGTAVGATIGEYITEIEGIDQRVTTIEGTLPGKWARINTNTDATTQNQLDINEKINGIELPIEVAWTIGNLSCTSGQAPVADSDPTYMHSSVITVASGNTYVDAAHAIHGLHVTLMSDWTVDFVKVYDSEGEYVYERHSGFSGVEAYTGAGAYMLVLYKGGQDISALDADRYVQIYETTTLSANTLIYRGKVTSTGNSFASCIKAGWYSFIYSEISGGYITDAPSDLSYAGILVNFPKAAGETTLYQKIIDHAGNEWRRNNGGNWTRTIDIAYAQPTNMEAAIEANRATLGFTLLSQCTEIQGNYNSQGKWTNIADTHKHIMIPISAGDLITINNGDLVLNYGILAQPTTVQNNKAADAAPIDGWTGCKSLARNTKIDIVAPDTATTLLIMTTQSSAARTFGLAINGIDYGENIRDHIAALKSKSAEIDGMADDVTLLKSIANHKPVIQNYNLTLGAFINNARVGDNWKSKISTNATCNYTPDAIDISDFIGGTIKIIMLPEYVSAGVQYGFCDSTDTISFVNLVRNDAVLNSDTGYYEISRQITDTHLFYSFRPNAGTATQGSIQLELLHSAAGVDAQKTIFIATDGSDSNSGLSASAPMATVNAALETGADTILMRAGVYEQTINLGKLKWPTLEIRNYDAGGRVIFRAPGSKIAGKDDVTAVSGHSGIFVCDFTGSFASGNNRIFLDNFADQTTLIHDTATQTQQIDRMPQQRGYTYRCEDTAIIKCDTDTTITKPADLDPVFEEIQAYLPRFKFFHDTHNGKLYFSTPETVDDTHSLRGSYNTKLFTGNNRGITLKLVGLEVKYQILNLNETTNSEVIDCRATDVYGAGAITYDNAIGLTLMHCEAARAYSNNHGDGINGHGINNGDPYGHMTSIHLIDCWSHDNVDDGFSDHEHCESMIDGGLFEYNYYGGGIAPSTGSHCEIHGAYCRENGEAGFLLLNSADEGEGGKGSQMYCVDCVSEHNQNWAGSAAPGHGGMAGFKAYNTNNRMILINCTAINEATGYLTSDEATAKLINCKAQGCTTVKSGSDFEIINAAAVE